MFRLFCPFPALHRDGNKPGHVIREAIVDTACGCCCNTVGTPKCLSAGSAVQDSSHSSSAQGAAGNRGSQAHRSRSGTCSCSTHDRETEGESFRMRRTLGNLADSMRTLLHQHIGQVADRICTSGSPLPPLCRPSMVWRPATAAGKLHLHQLMVAQQGTPQALLAHLAKMPMAATPCTVKVLQLHHR